jgi:formate dehydrogenase iron-sulfur subunit
MPLWTAFNRVLLALVALGGLSMIARFALGLGATTHLSNTWAWGLWIVFDFVWIAIAAGAFATAGLIYLFKRTDLYAIGRSAVLMGFLSYTFVIVTLVADLGLPWHFWQLGVQAPEHSAMFEVSWCIFLYVTVLAAEFLPSLFEGLGMKEGIEAWKRWAPVYVVFAMSLFVWLMSRNAFFTVGALVLFGALAYAFRAKPGERPVPVMLAIAAVTLSTMHQSSLGSLFLLMPDKLDRLFWSPIMPISFFLSAIAAGTALMVVIETWIAKAYRRPVRVAELAALGKVAFLALATYLVVRIGDVVLAGKLGSVFTTRAGALFLVEVVLLGIVPAFLLGLRKNRENPSLVFFASLLSVAGVIFNRANVVIFDMTLNGPLPGNAIAGYFPSLVEWGISVGLVAATIFLFGLAVRYLPILPAEERSPH